MNGSADATPSWDRLRLGNPDQWVRRHVVPFAVFMGFLLVLQLAGSFFQSDLPSDPWWRKHPEHWVYPVQTVICLFLLLRWWRSYEFRWDLKWSLVGVLCGAVGIGFWLLPTDLHDRLGVEGEGWWTWLGVKPRLSGFDPSDAFDEGGLAWWTALVLRFVRAVVVVALVEEIFWRSYLMRLVDDWDGDYWKGAFGKFSWRSYGLVTGAFMVAHSPSDYVGALAYGSLTYFLCVWSRNLGACVVMHAVANGLMGWYILETGKTGLW